MSNKDLKAGIAAGIIVAVAVPLVVAVLAMLNGWALSILWGWFVVPLFALPGLTVPQAIGLGLVSSLLAKQYIPSKGDDKASALVPFITPLCAIGFGWVVKLFL